MDAIFSLVSPEPAQKMIQRKVEKIFTLMDTNKDGVITEEEFTKYIEAKQELLLPLTT